MESFEVFWRSSTKKDLSRLPPQEVARIVAAIAEVPKNPFPEGSKKLSGSDQTHRIRVGDYRVIYEVFAKLKRVEIVRVRHRKDVYK